MSDAGAPPGTLDDVRRRRRATERAARRLLELDAGRGKVVRGLSWATFGDLPEWCLATDARREGLQRTCGALYHLPFIHRSLDGAHLRAWRRTLGDGVFEELMALDPPDAGEEGAAAIGSVDEPAPDDDPSTRIAQGGAAVLLGTLRDDGLVTLFAPLLGRSAPLPETTVADSLFALGVDIADRHAGTASPGAGPD